MLNLTISLFFFNMRPALIFLLTKFCQKVDPLKIENLLQKRGRTTVRVPPLPCNTMLVEGMSSFLLNIFSNLHIYKFYEVYTIHVCIFHCLHF